MAFKLNKETLLKLEKKDTLEHKNRISLFDKKVTHSKIIYDLPKIKQECNMKSIMVDKNLKLCYECEGNKQNEAIILMPSGPGGTHGVYHPYFSKLSNDYYIVYFDPIGVGQSSYDKTGKAYNTTKYLQYVEILRKHLKIKKWFVLGWSHRIRTSSNSVRSEILLAKSHFLMVCNTIKKRASFGGLMAQLYTLKHPTHVLGMILVNSVTGFKITSIEKYMDSFVTKDEQAYMQSIHAQLAKEKYSFNVIYYNKYMNGYWKKQTTYKPTKKELLESFATWKMDEEPNYNILMNNSGEKNSLLGKFDKCVVPTLIIESKYDLSFFKIKSELLYKNHPNAHYVQFTHSNHDVFQSETNKFFYVLNTFLTSQSVV